MLQTAGRLETFIEIFQAYRTTAFEISMLLL